MIAVLIPSSAEQTKQFSLYFAGRSGQNTKKPAPKQETGSKLYPKSLYLYDVIGSDPKPGLNHYHYSGITDNVFYLPCQITRWCYHNTFTTDCH